MNDRTQEQPQGERPRPSILVGGALPPPYLQTAQQEDELRQVVRKDLLGYCPAPWAQHTGRPLLNAGAPRQSTAPWLFTETDNPILRDLLGSQTPLPHQNTGLSNDGFARDAAHVESEGDPQGVASEALQSPANELIFSTQEDSGEEETASQPFFSNPTFSIGTSGEAGTRSESETTRYLDGDRESTSTFEDFLEGKYTVGGSVDGPSASATWRSFEDTEGLAQGSASFGTAEITSSAGANITGDWAGGDANINAEASARAAAAVFEAEGSLNPDGFLGARGNATVLQAEADAQGQVKIGTFQGSPTVTVEGSLAARLIVAEVEAEGVLSITPYRSLNPVIGWYNGVAEWAGWDSRLEELDKDWDWGIYLELGGKANVGVAASAEGGLGAMDDGRYGARGKVGASALFGFGATLGLGVQTPGE